MVMVHGSRSVPCFIGSWLIILSGSTGLDGSDGSAEFFMGCDTGDLKASLLPPATPATSFPETHWGFCRESTVEH